MLCFLLCFTHFMHVLNCLQGRTAGELRGTQPCLRFLVEVHPGMIVLESLEWPRNSVVQVRRALLYITL